MKNAMLFWELVDDGFDGNASSKVHGGLHRLFAGMPIDISGVWFACGEHCRGKRMDGQRNRRVQLYG